MVEFGGDGFLNRLRAKLANSFVVDNARRHLRNVLVDRLVLAINALTLRSRSGALAAKAHAGGAAVVLELWRRWNARKTVRSKVAGSLTLRIAIL